MSPLFHSFLVFDLFHLFSKTKFKTSQDCEMKMVFFRYCLEILVLGVSLTLILLASKLGFKSGVTGVHVKFCSDKLLVISEKLSHTFQQGLWICEIINQPKKFAKIKVLPIKCILQYFNTDSIMGWIVTSKCKGQEIPEKM